MAHEEGTVVVGRCAKCGLSLNDFSGEPASDREGEFGWVRATIKDNLGVYHQHCWGANGRKNEVAEARRLALMEGVKIAEDLIAHYHDLRANGVLQRDCRFGDGVIDGAHNIASSLRSAAEMPKTDSATQG